MLHNSSMILNAISQLAPISRISGSYDPTGGSEHVARAELAHRSFGEFPVVRPSRS